MSLRLKEVFFLFLFRMSSERSSEEEEFDALHHQLMMSSMLGVRSHMMVSSGPPSGRMMAYGEAEGGYNSMAGENFKTNLSILCGFFLEKSDFIFE